jgi:hypothetical protein
VEADEGVCGPLAGGELAEPRPDSGEEIRERVRAQQSGVDEFAQEPPAGRREPGDFHDRDLLGD